MEELDFTRQKHQEIREMSSQINDVSNHVQDLCRGNLSKSFKVFGMLRVLPIFIMLMLSLVARADDVSGYVGDWVDLNIGVSSSELLGDATWKIMQGPQNCIDFPSRVGAKTSVNIISYYTGKVVILAKYQLKNGQNKQKYFNISCNPVTLNVSPARLNFEKVGDKDIIQYTTSPAGKYPQVGFESSNKNVATVSYSGQVTAEGKGSTIITVTNNMGPNVEIPVSVSGGDDNGGDNGGGNNGGDNGGDDNKVIHDGDYFQYKTVEGYNMLFLAYKAYGELCCMVTPSPDGFTAVSKSVKGKVTIPAHASNLKVCSLEDQAFSYLSGLNELVIPYTVFYVGNICQGCYNLSKVTCEATTPPTCSSSAFTSDTYKGTLYVPKGCVSKYKNAKVWKDFKDIREIGSPENDVVINEENFPDENFRKYLLENEYGKDKVLTTAEIEEITVLDLNNKGLKNVKGIEHFYALEKLWCSYNQISELDVSKNPCLTQLSCNFNEIKELNLSKNTSFKSLICYYNQIKSLNLSENTKLEELTCYGNPLEELDLSKNTKLTYLNCENTQLTSLDLSKNTKLTSLYCGSTKLQSLDLTTIEALKKIDCSNTQLTESFINDVIERFSLESLNCSGIQLETLNISHLSELKWLYCSNCSLQSLNVTTNKKLQDLNCSSNNLTELDLSENILLTRLSCSNNQLKSLDLSSHNLLEDLNCNGNSLASLLVNGEAPLNYIYCYKNKIKNVAMDDFLNSLPQNKKSWSTTIKLIRNGRYEKNMCTTSQIEIAKAKGWVIEFYAGVWEEYVGPIYPTTISPFSFDPTYTMTIGETETLDYSIKPINATHACLDWISDDPSVAEVTDTGIVTAKGEGTTKITCSSTEGICEPAYFTIKVHSDTGINDVMQNSNKNISIYDVFGRKLEVPHKGINIIQGKKFIMK